jgi:hypothetical protein
MLCSETLFLVFVPGKVRLWRATFSYVLRALLFGAELGLLRTRALMISKLFRQCEQGSDDVRSVNKRVFRQDFPCLWVNPVRE